MLIKDRMIIDKSLTNEMTLTHMSVTFSKLVRHGIEGLDQSRGR